MALIRFARDDPLVFDLTVPLAGIVILAGALLFFRIIVFRPLSLSGERYTERRRQSRDPELPFE